jgi:hypothetical protein
MTKALRALLGACGALAALATTAAVAGAAPTPAGTVIQNTASITYQDVNGTSYSNSSNTVSTTVQNAPSLTVATNGAGTGGTGAQTVAPGQVVSDTYTLTNTGNNSGTFAVTAGASGVTGSGNDNGSAGTVQYVYNSTTYGSVASLNTALAGASVAPNAAVTITVQYTLSGTPPNVPGDVTTALQGTLAYAAIGGAGAVTSAATTNTYDDTVRADARLDLQTTSSQNGATGVITYTVNANNGSSSFATKALQGAQNLGFPAAGILITDKVPQFGGAPLAFASAPTLTTNAGNGYAGTSATMYYTTNATGASGWTLLGGGATPPAGTTFIAAFVQGASALAPHAGSSAGNVPAPQVTLTFAIVQPTGTGSGNPGSVIDVANAMTGNNSATEQIVGPGASSGSTDGNTAGAGTAIVSMMGNATPLAAPSGASNQTSNQALTSAVLYNGPVGAPNAIGSYDGVVAVNVGNHFTAASFTSSNQAINSGTVPGTPVGNTTVAAVNGINVPNQIQNAGNTNDTYTIVANAPSGFTVQLFQDNGIGTPGSGTGGNGPGATPLGGASAGATSTANGIAVASGGTLIYWAVYTAPAGTTYYARYDGVITATGSGGSPPTATQHNELYSGFIVGTKTMTVTSSNCPAGSTPSAPAGTVCPGGTIQYTLDYRNIMKGPGAGATIPVSAQLFSKPGTLVVTEDGAAGSNNWATFSDGLLAPATDTTAGSVFTANTVNSTSFTCTVGGASFQLPPGANGQIVFSVRVK